MRHCAVYLSPPPLWLSAPFMEASAWYHRLKTALINAMIYQVYVDFNMQGNSNIKCLTLNSLMLICTGELVPGREDVTYLSEMV